MKTPHKHAEVIKAWADGEQIQARRDEGDEWADISLDRMWRDTIQYRIKPVPWFRVALMRSVNSADSYRYTASVGNPDGEEMLSRAPGFIRWLTPRTEYEVDVE